MRAPRYESAADADADALRNHRALVAKVGAARPFTSTVGRRAAFGRPTEPEATCLLYDAKRGRPSTASAPADKLAFRPSSPAKSGSNATLLPFPEQLAEPFDEVARRQAQLPARRQPVAVTTKNLAAHLKERKPFRPPTGKRTGVNRVECLAGEKGRL